MEFRDLKKQYLSNKNEIDNIINDVVMKGTFIGGTPVRQLELSLADYVGVKHCISCANGTDALHLALLALGVGKKDAVFVPDFTFFSTGEVVPLVGATPIFVDVDYRTYNMSPNSLEKMIRLVLEQGNLSPKAIIAVDLFGQPAEYKSIYNIARKYNMFVIEDGAQGFGGRIKDSKACSFGDISTTSFFPAKPLGCYGDGGAVFTNNDEWDSLIRSLCVHGKGNNKYDNIRIGYNSRLDTIQAAILSVKLKMFEERELIKVNEVAGWYSEMLREVKENITIPVVLPNYYSSWAQYTICFRHKEMRNEVQQDLANSDIPSMIYYVKPLHKQLAFVDILKGKFLEDLVPNSIMLSERVLSLPIHPYMEKGDVEFVCNKIKKCIDRRRETSYEKSTIN